MTTTITATAAGTWKLGGELPVARMGFGAMRLTGPGIWGEPRDRDECIAVLRRSVEREVTFIDTADAYGPEVSESLIAEALHPYPDDLVIGTKAGLLRDGPDQWRPDGRPEHLREAVEGSLRRLRVERLDLLQLHRPDPAVPLEESMGELARLRDEGKIRLIGVCNVDERQLEVAMRVTPVVSVQNRMNLEDRSSDTVLVRCEAEQLAFLPWAPLGAGRWRRAGDVLVEVAKRHDATPNQVALAWLLARSPVMLVIPGTSTRAHLDENIDAAGIELTADQLDLLDRAGA
ncbi:MAG TPA: aldo/keto reductase [Acidimicrobiia bacterium]|jgi:aryl-alcohol dehydrogenase-like predicted oxidoreductase